LLCPPCIQELVTMNENTLVTVLLTLLASSGFWAFVIATIEKKSARNKMLLGLGHDRIIYLGMKYVEKGEITQGEYENLNKYLYEPYKKMGGNGTAERLMQEVNKLRIVPDTYPRRNGG